MNDYSKITPLLPLSVGNEGRDGGKDTELLADK